MFAKSVGFVIAGRIGILPPGGGGEVGGIEVPRVNVVLATGISEEECRIINLGYLDFRKMKIEDYTGKEDQGILKVENAGEVLFRLAGDIIPDVDKL